MMVPGVDMFRLFLMRILSKKNPFSPDRNHIHHLLLNKIFKYKNFNNIKYSYYISNYIDFSKIFLNL